MGSLVTGVHTYALPIGQVRQHDRARELPCRIRGDMREHRAVAQMDVPVVGAADGQAVGHGGPLGRSWLGFGWGVPRLSSWPIPPSTIVLLSACRARTSAAFCRDS